MPDPKPPADLDALKRDQLDKVAAEAGVPDPGKLPNKDAVIDAIEAPNPALAVVADEATERTWKVTGGSTVHDTPTGGTFAAVLTPQIALLVEGGHITDITEEG